ncbi:MAG: ribosome small subunit-dependent GTPase A [Clostridia bacterium]|nr:ribosome small subunit-dependent GTPase A [Clostridia bacterium]
MEQTTSQRNVYLSPGLILSGVGGRYTIELDNIRADAPLHGQTVVCRAKGAFRHDCITPLPGDRVTISYSDASFRRQGDTILPDPDGTDIRIEKIHPRYNELIRPPMANLDMLFITLAAAAPAPLLPMVDKLLCIAEHNRIEPVVIIGKRDLQPAYADELLAIYQNAGFAAFGVSAQTGEGVDALRAYIASQTPSADNKRKIAAFAGASGVGKSTLMNLLFPSLSQETGSVSEKTERGRHTTRQVTIFPAQRLHLTDGSFGGFYIADTPGFSLLDLERFDFFEKDDLPLTMREFRPYLGQCRYTDCTHTKEQDCAIVIALQQGKIAPCRHESFLIMYNELKDKRPWNKPQRKF